MTKYALGIEYDGTGYHGWQTQVSAPSVQSNLEQALSQVAIQPIAVHAAGRTDRGVHATHQIVHFETDVTRDMKAWVMGTNTHLPSDIRVLWAQPVAPVFHARFAAISRRYHYVIYNHSTQSALLRRGVGWHYYPLDASLMGEAIQCLVGEHDFGSFRAAGCQAKHGVRRILAASVHRQGDFVIVDVKGNGFLHHMVRNIVGALFKVGHQEEPPAWFHWLLEQRNRTKGGVTAPPQGLYLTQIGYPPEFELPTACRLPLLLAH